MISILECEDFRAMANEVRSIGMAIRLGFAAMAGLLCFAPFPDLSHLSFISLFQAPFYVLFSEQENKILWF